MENPRECAVEGMGSLSTDGPGFIEEPGSQYVDGKCDNQNRNSKKEDTFAALSFATANVEPNDPPGPQHYTFNSGTHPSTWQAGERLYLGVCHVLETLRRRRRLSMPEHIKSLSLPRILCWQYLCSW